MLAWCCVCFRSVEAYGKEEAEGFSANAFFKALGNFVGIFGGAFLIGSLFGMVTALLTKYTKIRDFPLLETALFFLMSYASFQTSEAAGLTGMDIFQYFIFHYFMKYMVLKPDSIDYCTKHKFEQWTKYRQVFDLSTIVRKGNFGSSRVRLPEGECSNVHFCLVYNCKCFILFQAR